MKKQGLDANDVMGIICHMGGARPADIADAMHATVLKVFTDRVSRDNPKFVKVEQLLKEYRDHIASAQNNGEAFDRVTDLDKFITEERLSA